MNLYRVTWTNVTRFGQSYGVSSRIVVGESESSVRKSFEDERRYNVEASPITSVDGYRIILEQE